MDQSFQPRSRKENRRNGVALVSLLALMTLTTIVVLSFMALSRDELKSSTIYADGIRAGLMADSVVKLAIGQLREATSDPDLIWVSQPGGIRTYSRDGEFHRGYKLYSDDLMVIPGDEKRFAEEDAADFEQWAEAPSRWTDLNEPVIRDSEVFFPIVDPAAKTKMRVQGFDFDKSEMAVGPMEAALVKAGTESLPMPVRWIYQLADGTIGVLDANEEFVSMKIDVDGTVQEQRNLASKRNPIVARFAFWADDETSKVNLNTSAEPTFWDTPRAASKKPKGKGKSRKEYDDRSYGWSQPAQGEYTRFPGHPAQTALSPIFFEGKDLTKGDKEIIIEAAPQQGWGGSKAGTVAFRDSTRIPDNTAHLYPSVDEYLFGPGRKPNPLSRDTVREIPREKMIEWGRFFLTTSSRAPELNALHKPRVSIWPTHYREETEEGEHRTAFDDLIRFCSSYGPADSRFHYSFQRRNSDDPFEDFASIPRNREIFEYLRRLTGERAPGYGGSLEQKWGEDRDQILTEIFDYIRCTNLYDENLEPLAYKEADWKEEQKQSQFTDGRRGAHSRSSFPGHGQVVPLELEKFETRGLGRFYTVSEAGFMLICCGDAGGPDPKDPERPRFPHGILRSNVVGNGRGQNRALPRKLRWEEEYQERCLQAVLLFELFCPSQGWTQICDDMTIRVEFEKNFTIDGEPVKFPAVSEFDWKSTGDCYTGGSRRRGGRIGFLGEVPYSSTWGGTVPFWSLAKGRLAPPLGHLAPDGGRQRFEGNERNRSDEARRAYPFISVPFVVKGNDGTISFEGCSFRLHIHQGTTHSRIPATPGEDNLVQTIEFKFPATSLPIPELAKFKGKRTPRREPVKEGDEYRYELDYKYDSKGRPIGSGSGVIHPSFYWIMNADGCGVGAAEHGYANWGGWSRNPANHEQERIRMNHRGRLAMWANDWRTLFIQRATGGGFDPKKGADVVRTLVPSHGDYRHIAAMKEVGSEVFVPHRHYFDEDRYLAHQLTSSHMGRLAGYGLDRKAAPLVSELAENKKHLYHVSKAPDFPQTRDSLDRQKWGDFDNGVSVTADGPYINKPDEGNGRQRVFRNGSMSVPYYYQAGQQVLGGAAHFSPNRQVASPVVFGSLPTGVLRDRPWETLLFRPEPGHPGMAKPEGGEERGSLEAPDHAVLDLFRMPVVEPWAISEPFSTAGKINLNCALLPFSHIDRSTGIAAVLKSERILAIPNWAGRFYKQGALPSTEWTFRHPVDFEETRRQWDERFEKGRLFLSAGELCELHLVPDREKSRVTLEEMRGAFWDGHAVTGDNSRERPYANIYPRITTRSDTFRVHYRVQILKSGRESDPGKFQPQFDTVAADERGDFLVERYIDPSDPDLPDFAGDEETEETLLDFYRYRILSTRRFAP